MTIEQVKQDIKDGKSTMIFYGSQTLWWTHLDSDLEDATAKGKIAREKMHTDMMENPNVPQEHKDKMSSLYEMANKSAVGIPSDPTGAPLYQMQEPLKWITEAEAKPEHFGEHGLEAFMKTHHQNCDDKCHAKWEEYNKMIDESK